MTEKNPRLERDYVIRHFATIASDYLDAIRLLLDQNLERDADLQRAVAATADEALRLTTLLLAKVRMMQADPFAATHPRPLEVSTSDAKRTTPMRKQVKK